MPDAPQTLAFDVVLPASDFDEPQKRELVIDINGEKERIDLIPNTTLLPNLEAGVGDLVHLQLIDHGVVIAFKDLYDSQGMVHRNRRFKEQSTLKYEVGPITLSKELPWCPAGRLGIRVHQDGSQDSLVASFQSEESMRDFIRSQTQDMPE